MSVGGLTFRLYGDIMVDVQFFEALDCGNGIARHVALLSHQPQFNKVMNPIFLLAFIDVVLITMMAMLTSGVYRPTKVIGYGFVLIGIAILGSWIEPCAIAANVAL